VRYELVNEPPVWCERGLMMILLVAVCCRTLIIVFTSVQLTVMQNPLLPLAPAADFCTFTSTELHLKPVHTSNMLETISWTIHAVSAKSREKLNTKLNIRRQV